MRHNLGYRKLNRTPEHRKALFKNMLNSLIKYEQIVTTLPKAKELKPLIDKVITIGKKNTLRFEEVRDFLIQNFNQKYHNKTISSELQTNGFTRILINSGENNRDGIKAIWIRA